jgi:hypothetical protein
MQTIPIMAISPGHVPAINPVAKIAEGWILEWQAERGDGDLPADGGAP